MIQANVRARENRGLPLACDPNSATFGLCDSVNVRGRYSRLISRADASLTGADNDPVRAMRTIVSLDKHVYLLADSTLPGELPRVIHQDRC